MRFWKLWVGAILLCLLAPLRSAAQTPAPADSAGYTYRADHVEDDLQTGRVVLSGNVVIHYKGIELHAGRVVLDRKTERLEAEALPDSTGARTVGRPVFIRNGERFTATWMVYDLKTGQGRVRGGRAAYEHRYYYRGENLLLDRADELYAHDISMTTCDLPSPHYDFLCKDLKVIQNDKAIARSVTLRIGPVPIIWIPYYVFPLRKGRHSGILTPTVGSNSRDGIFVRNVGYYFAPSDYWDATISAVLRERNGFLVDSRAAYAVRRRLSGSVDFSFENATGVGSRAWRLDIQHRQTLSPTFSMSASGQFTSSATFDQRNSDNLYNYLNRQLRSTFSLDKNWPRANRSLDASLSYYRDLEQSQNSFQGFPRLSFRQGRRRLFGQPASSASQAWYQAFYYSFSSNLTNSFTRNPDPANNTDNLALQSQFSVNSQNRPFGVLDLSPTFSVNQTFSRNNQSAPTRQETYSAVISTGTTLYGIFSPHIGRLRGIRHRLQPRLDFRYSQYGHVNGGFFGFGGHHTWDSAQRSLDMSLNNAFDVKTEVNGKERRSTFATLNFSTGYDFDSAVQKWNPLITSLSVKPDRRVDIRLTTSHLFYDAQGRRDLLHPHLQSLTVTSNFRFSGSAGPASDLNAGSLTNQMNFQSSNPTFGVEGGLYGNSSNTSQPWQFNLTHYYSYQKLSGISQTRSWLKIDLGFDPTPHWRLDYSANYDLIGSSFTAQSISFYRDLHCWEARLALYPSGIDRGFYFKINIKAIPQIKFEHRQGGYGL